MPNNEFYPSPAHSVLKRNLLVEAEAESLQQQDTDEESVEHPAIQDEPVPEPAEAFDSLPQPNALSTAQQVENLGKVLEIEMAVLSNPHDSIVLNPVSMQTSRDAGERGVAYIHLPQTPAAVIRANTKDGTTDNYLVTIAMPDIKNSDERVLLVSRLAQTMDQHPRVYGPITEKGIIIGRHPLMHNEAESKVFRIDGILRLDDEGNMVIENHNERGLEIFANVEAYEGTVTGARRAQLSEEAISIEALAAILGKDPDACNPFTSRFQVNGSTVLAKDAAPYLQK